MKYNFTIVDPNDVEKIYTSILIRTKMFSHFGLDPLGLRGLQFVAKQVMPVLKKYMENPDYCDDIFRLEMQLAFDQVSKRLDILAKYGECPFKEGWYLRMLEIMEESVN